MNSPLPVLANSVGVLLWYHLKNILSEKSLRRAFFRPYFQQHKIFNQAYTDYFDHLENLRSDN